MSIAWIYLDKKSAAVNALKDYASMEYIIANHAEAVAEVRESMTAPRSGSVSSLAASSVNDPHSGETKLAAQLDEIDVLKERYRRALEFVEWFRPAWETLTDDERLTLTEFFLREDISKTEAVLNLGEHFHLERAQVYRRKDKTIDRLTLLLYGK